MKIIEFKIDKLFGIHNYDLKFSLNEHVSILHAPNGNGKTTILKLIKSIVDYDFIFIDQTPFEFLQLHLDNGDIIKIFKKNIFSNIMDMNSKEFEKNYRLNQSIEVPFQFIINGKQFKINLNRDINIYISRRTIMYDNDSDANTMSVYDVVKKFNISPFQSDELMKKYSEYKNKLNVHFIEANRIYKSIVNMEDNSYRNRRERINEKESIRLYSDELNVLISQAKSEFGAKSEQLDRTLPKRVLTSMLNNYNSNNEIENIEALKLELSELETRRNELSKISLLTEQTTESISNIREDLNQDICRFLRIYIDDSNQKLDTFNNIKEKLTSFSNIINGRSKYTNKKMTINSEKGIAFTLNDTYPVPLEKLSSGEKNNIILFYELIFKCEKNYIVLIDEPEISLHILWQQQFIKELLNITSRNGIQAIVATHSPNIVYDYDDLLIDME